MYYRTSDARELEIVAANQKAEVRRDGNALVIVYPTHTSNVPLMVIVREGEGHFPLSPKDPRDAVELIVRNTR